MVVIVRIQQIFTFTIVEGPSLFPARWGPTCIINDYSTPDPYLYIFAGCSKSIERININNLDSWHELTIRFNEETVGLTGSTFDFSSHFSYFGVFSYQNYIILMNGWDDYNGGENEMFLFDATKLTLEYFGQFPFKGWATAPVFAQNRVFVFGGQVYGVGASDAIYISDEISVTTSSPTQLPTFPPSAIPSTMPSATPSVTSTAMPSVGVVLSTIPDTTPSTMPSSTPTKSPLEITAKNSKKKRMQPD